MGICNGLRRCTANGLAERYKVVNIWRKSSKRLKLLDENTGHGKFGKELETLFQDHAGGQDVQGYRGSSEDSHDHDERATCCAEA